MQLIIAAALIASTASAAFAPADSCTDADINNLATGTCLGPVIAGLTALNVNLGAKGKDHDTAFAMAQQNKTCNLTTAFNKIPAFVSAIAAQFGGPIDYDGLNPTIPSNLSAIESYNDVYRLVVCPILRTALDTITTCIPKTCNETTWAYCANSSDATGGNIAGFGGLVPSYATALGGVMRVSCLNPRSTDDAGKCKVLFPGTLFGTYVPPPATNAPVGGNSTSASSSVEIAVLAAASLVATTMLAF